MAKRFNKTKLIKKYFGDIIKEYGFEYGGADAWTWNFFRQKENVKQEIIIMRHRFFADQIKLIFFTGVYCWGDQEPHDFIEKYKDKEFWIYETEEEYIGILQEFAGIVRDYGLERLEEMLVPSDPIFATPEMHQYLYENYESLIAEADTKYDFGKTGEEGIRNVSSLLYQNKDREFEEAKEFLIDMAAIYLEIFKNDMGGKIVFENEICILEETGIHHRNAVYPLMGIVSKWKGYRENLVDGEDFLVITYQQLKGIR